MLFANKGVTVESTALFALMASLLPIVCPAQTPEGENWSAKGQATYVYEYKPRTRIVFIYRRKSRSAPQ
jgi:hypothetical protein